MSEHMKTHPTKFLDGHIVIIHKGDKYVIPEYAIEEYKDEGVVSADEVFAELDAKYSKAGVLLQGIRARDDLTQKQLAEMIEVSQPVLSQMENGKRRVGRKIAKRIEKVFGVHYRSFLE